MKLIPFLTFATFVLLHSDPAQAIEVQNPKNLCERFLTASERARCEEQMKTLNPDWYLAGVCNKQFEDKAFYDCLSFSKSAQFSPQKLDACAQAETTDEGRMACVRAAQVTPAQAFQSTTPAAHSSPPGSR